MNRHKLALVFKGARAYVHGSTIWDETTRLLAQAGYRQLNAVEFIIHNMTDTNLSLVIEPRGEPSACQDAIALLHYVTDGIAMQARICRDDGRPDMRIPYDESWVPECCTIDPSARKITLTSSQNLGFTPIEVLVAMTKALHLAVLDKPKEASWVFCRWCCTHWPLIHDLTGVTITLKQALGTKLTRSRVMLHDSQIGLIDFSAKVMA